MEYNSKIYKISERKPENHQIVMCCHDLKNERYRYFWFRWEFVDFGEGKIAKWRENNSWFECKNDDIWMELPKIYEKI